MSESSLVTRVAEIQTAEQLAACLADLRKEAGQPSLRDIEQWGAHQGLPLARATVDEVLRGVRLPNGTLLLNLLNCLGIRPGSTDIAVWLEALDRAEGARDKSRRRSRSERDLGPVSAARFFVTQDSLEEIKRLINNAQEQVWLWGTTLSMHISFLARPYLQEALDRGVLVKVLLIPREGTAMTMAAFRAGSSNALENMQRDLDNNLAALSALAADHPGLEIKLIDYLAPYTLYGYDPGNEAGRMDLRLGSFNGHHDYRPTFTLERARDGEWFDYFYEQFVLAWKAADPA